MTELPELTTPPRATDTQAHYVTIEWDAWNPLHHGDPPITKYIIYYRKPHADGVPAQWQRFSEIPVSDMTLLEMINNLTRETTYELSVSVSREGTGGEGAKSPSISVTTLCSSKYTKT